MSLSPVMMSAMASSSPSHVSDTGLCVPWGHPVPPRCSSTPGGTHILEGPPEPPCPRDAQSPTIQSSSHQWYPHLWGTSKAILSPGHRVPRPHCPRAIQSLPRCCSHGCFPHPGAPPWSPCPQDHTGPCQAAPAPTGGAYMSEGPHWRCPSGATQLPSRCCSSHPWCPHPLGPWATPLLPERRGAAGAVATGWHCGTVPELSPGLTRGRSPASRQPHAAPGAEPPDALLCPDGGPRHAARHRHHAHRRPLLLPQVSPGDGDVGVASCLVPPELW